MCHPAETARTWTNVYVSNYKLWVDARAIETNGQSMRRARRAGARSRVGVFVRLGIAQMPMLCIALEGRAPSPQIILASVGNSSFVKV